MVKLVFARPLTLIAQRRLPVGHAEPDLIKAVSCVCGFGFGSKVLSKPNQNDVASVRAYTQIRLD
jgi:hypothetical protein